jgi:hypothetical protein
MKLGPQAFEHAVKYFSGSVAKEEMGEATKAVAFPNPIYAEEYVIIQFDGIFNSASISITDANGKILYERNYSTPDNLLNVPVSSLSPGLYVVNVQSNIGRFNKKIVKY